MNLVALVVGPTGAGKSSLIKMYSLSSSPVVGHTLSSQTTSTTQHLCKIGGLSVAMYDTPGLGDTESRDQDFLDNTLTIMHHACSGIHKVLICLPVTEARASGPVMEGFKLMVDLLGGPTAVNDCNTALVLTKANQLHKDYWNEGIDQKMQDWSNQIRKASGTSMNVLLHGNDNESFLASFIAFTDPTKPPIRTANMQRVETMQSTTKRLTQEKEDADRLVQEAKSDTERIAAQLIASNIEIQRQTHEIARIIALQQERDRMYQQTIAAMNANGRKRKRCTIM